MMYLSFFLGRPLYAQENWFGPVSVGDCVGFRHLSVAFADESLRSPASMFGHTFLVFHNDPRPELEAMTLEFVGDTSSTEFPVFRSLFWSIEGRFLVRRLTYKLLEYGREGRDVRIWRIGAVPATCARTLYAAIHQPHEYSFLRRNCAWHAAKVASDLVGARNEGWENAIPLSVPVTIPVKTLNQFIRPESLRGDTIFVSQKRRASTAFSDLSEAGRDTVGRIFDGYSHSNGAIDPLEARAIEEIGSVRLTDEGSPERRREIFQIKKRFLFATNKGIEPAVFDPGDGKESDLVRRRVGAIGASVLGPDFGVRLHGHLGMRSQKMASLGIPERGELQILDFVVRGFKYGVGVERLGLVRLDAAVADSTMLPGFTRLIDVAYESYRNAVGDELQREAGLRFGGGRTITFAGSNWSLMLVGTARYIDVPDVESFDSASDMTGFAARWSLRLRGYLPVTPRGRVGLIAEYFARDHFPVRSVLDFVIISDLDLQTATHFGYRGLGVRTKRRIQGEWEVGITRSI